MFKAYKYRLFIVMLIMALSPITLAEERAILSRMGMIETDYRILYNDKLLEVVKQGIIQRSVSEKNQYFAYGYREWFLEIMYKKKDFQIHSMAVNSISFLDKNNELLYADNNFPALTSFFLSEEKIADASYLFLAINLEDIPFLILDNIENIHILGGEIKLETPVKPMDHIIDENVL